MAEMKKFAVVDIGGTKIRWALWDGHGLSEVNSQPTPKVSGPEFLQKILQNLSSLGEMASLSGVGVSTAGPVDVVNGCILNPANLGNGDSTWRQFALKKELSAALNLKVVLDNDAAMTAFGHFHHIEKKAIEDLVVVTLGTGLGVGAVVGGQLVRAGQNMHPELGHFIVADKADPEFATPFANFPTLESYLSGFHFSNRVGKSLGQNISGTELIELSETGNPMVLEMWEQYARRMAVGLANLYLAYYPKKIVIAGGFAVVAAPYFMARAKKTLEQILQGQIQAGIPLPTIEISAHHEELPLFGAGYKIQHSE